MIEKIAKHTFKKDCGVNIVIFKVCLTTLVKHKIYMYETQRKLCCDFA